MERQCGAATQSSVSRAEIVYCVAESPPCLSLNLSVLVKVIFCKGSLCVYKMKARGGVILNVTKLTGPRCCSK